MILIEISREYISNKSLCNGVILHWLKYMFAKHMQEWSLNSLILGIIGNFVMLLSGVHLIKFNPFKVNASSSMGYSQISLMLLKLQSKKRPHKMEHLFWAIQMVTNELAKDHDQFHKQENQDSSERDCTTDHCHKLYFIEFYFSMMNSGCRD